MLFEYLEAGMTLDEVIEQFPVTREQLESFMAFLARTLDREPASGWPRPVVFQFGIQRPIR
jgi:uncharacterized protein (DUF433 family)